MPIAAQVPPSKDIRPNVTETLETSARELTTGSTFAGRYQIIEELGKGSMGKVYRAVDKKLNEEVAIKLIKPEIALDKGTLARFQNELKVASPHLKSIIQFALDTGLRLQEILTLQTEDVDFGQEVIRIRPEVNKSGKHDFIPLLPRPKELISNLKAANGGRTSFVFNYLDPHTNELRPIRSIQHAFQTACRKAGITGLQFRDLRRTFSTRLHEKGLDLLIIQRLLRHSSPRISAEVYIQTSMRMMKEALEKISSREEKPASLEQIWNMGRMEKDKQLLNPWFSVN